MFAKALNTLLLATCIVLISARSAPERMLIVKLDRLSCTLCKEQLKATLLHYTVDRKHPVIVFYPDNGKLQQKTIEQKIKNEVCGKAIVVFISENMLSKMSPFTSFRKSPEIFFKYRYSSVMFEHGPGPEDTGLSQRIMDEIRSYFRE